MTTETGEGARGQVALITPQVRVSLAALPTAAEWSTMTQMAQVLVETRFVPEHIKTVQQALACMLKGRELGVPPTVALCNIMSVQGKPSANAELMAALIYRDHGDMALDFEEASNKRCTINYKRRGGVARRYTFSWEDAVTAGLTTGRNAGTWAKFPAAMLKARATTAVARLAFADSIGGMYTPDELDAPVIIDAEGQVVADPTYLRAQAETTAASEDPAAGALVALKARLLVLCAQHRREPPRTLGAVKELSLAFGVEPLPGDQLAWYDRLVAAMEQPATAPPSPPAPPAPPAAPTVPQEPPAQTAQTAEPLDEAALYAALEAALEANADLGARPCTRPQQDIVAQQALAAGIAEHDLARLLAALFPVLAPAEGLLVPEALSRQQAAATAAFLRSPLGRESARGLLARVHAA